MKNELHILTSYVGLLVSNRPTYINTEVLKSIKIESERLREVFLSIFNQAPDRFQTAIIFNNCYLQFIGLANVLWERARDHNPIARSALMILISLTAYLEQHYSDFLEQNQQLSDFERFKLSNYLSTELIAIQNLLAGKNISKPLIYQIGKAFEDLFKENKPGEITLADRVYVSQFLPQLKSLASDERDKDWNQRLRQLLIKNNFNHMGIYKLLEAEHEKTITSIKDDEAQHQILYDRYLTLEQIQGIPDLAYNLQANSLKNMLIKHIGLLQLHLKEKAKIRYREKQYKLRHNLSVAELSIKFHYEYEEHAYDYLTKTENAAAFCRHNQSKGTVNISKKSILKFDKLELRSEALSYYQMLGRIREKVKIDFDL